MTNESKWFSTISAIVAAVIPLLVAYGIFTAEQGEMWQTLALAVVAAIVALVVPITVTSLAKNYLNNETAHSVSLMENETARLMAGRE